MIRVIAARPVLPTSVEVTFEDGLRGIVDLGDVLWGEMFEPLRDPDVFATVQVDPVFGALAWANGADLSPEYLRAAVERLPV